MQLLCQIYPEPPGAVHRVAIVTEITKSAEQNGAVRNADGDGAKSAIIGQIWDAVVVVCIKQHQIILNLMGFIYYNITDTTLTRKIYNLK